MFYLIFVITLLKYTKNGPLLSHINKCENEKGDDNNEISDTLDGNVTIGDNGMSLWVFIIKLKIKSNKNIGFSLNICMTRKITICTEYTSKHLT